MARRRDTDCLPNLNPPDLHVEIGGLVRPGWSDAYRSGTVPDPAGRAWRMATLEAGVDGKVNPPITGAGTKRCAVVLSPT